MACCGQGQRKASKAAKANPQNLQSEMAQKINSQIAAQNAQPGLTTKKQPFNPFFHKFNRYANM